MSDPADPAHWTTGLSADASHPNDAGAEVLGDAVDLALFDGRTPGAGMGAGPPGRLNAVT